MLVGAPEQIADELEKWTAVGVDGFNLAYAITPGSFVDFVEGVVPVLQRRGLVQKEYAPGTLRAEDLRARRTPVCSDAIRLRGTAKRSGGGGDVIVLGRGSLAPAARTGSVPHRRRALQSNQRTMQLQENQS